jgi:hypothetical protein
MTHVHVSLQKVGLPTLKIKPLATVLKFNIS